MSSIGNKTLAAAVNSAVLPSSYYSGIVMHNNPAMQNHYELLGVERGASTGDIKRAFREKAKRLHPDIAGAEAGTVMQRLLAAYEVLSSAERRFEYDRAYARFIKNLGFDYRRWLRENPGDPVCQAKLVFFELLHLEEDEAVAIWDRNGGIDFPMEQYLDREDWMDCLFLLAEELDKRQRCHEAFTLLVILAREERRRPYFRHFMAEVEACIRTLVRQRLRPQVDAETWIGCMESLLGLGFPARDEKQWMRSMAAALRDIGDDTGAQQILQQQFHKQMNREQPLPRGIA